MPYCAQCGKVNKEEDIFCSQCGKKKNLDEDEPGHITTGKKYNDKEEFKKISRTKILKKVLKIVTLIGLIIIFIMFIDTEGEPIENNNNNNDSVVDLNQADISNQEQPIEYTNPHKVNNYHFDFIGRPFSEVEKEINNWVYGKDVIIKEVGANPLHPELYLDLELTERDHFYYLFNLFGSHYQGGALFVVRNNIIICEIEAPGGITIYEFIPPSFLNVEPSEVLKNKKNFTTLKNLIGPDTISIYSWEVENGALKIVSQKNYQQFYKNSVLWYIIKSDNIY